MTTLTGVISYPIPLYQNLPIEPQFYQPSVFSISAITRGITTTITTTVNMNYTIGQLIRLLIPVKYGCTQLNQQTGYVLSLPALNQVVVGINSTNADAFISNPTFLPGQSTQPAQIVAIGDVNTGQNNANGPQNITTYVPGSFINISPL